MPDRSRPPLPIDEILPAILESLARCPNLVIYAPPGAGKTTRVPPALLEPSLGIRGQIVALQPRRMAARAAAARIAAEGGTRLGDEVGYIVRFDSRVGRTTRIVLATEGILLRMLHDDPLLESVGAVLFDEFHERNLNSDLALGMVRRIQQTVRPELKIAVLSATLDAAPIAKYLDDCPVIESQGRTYPVEIEYLRQVEQRPIAALAASGVEQIVERTAGDVLVFLPGVGEIRQTAAALAPAAKRWGVSVMELFGDLPPERQDAVLAPLPHRKIVLATNVAETSLTIPGITAVVDTGLARQQRYDPAVGLDRLSLVPISKASADQRAGRAGRTAPGLCLRLWNERSHAHRPAFELPEIHRADLAAALLQLWSWGESDPAAFPWFECPLPAAIEAALLLLRRLGAIKENQITDRGRLLARLPISPRLGALLLEGHRRGCLSQAALAAALLFERDPFVRSGTGGNAGGDKMRTTASYVSRSDVLDRVLALERFEKTGRVEESSFGSINPSAAAFVIRARDQWQTEIAREWEDAPGNGAPPHPDALLHSLLEAFPDRLARRRDSSTGKGVMVGGRGVKLGPQSAVTAAELFLCIDVDAGQTEATVRQASTVEREWLPADRLRTVDAVFFHPTQKAVVGRRRTMWFDLILDEVDIPVPLGEESACTLSEAAWRDWDRVFPIHDESVKGFLGRVRSLAGWMPDLKLPTFDDAELKEILLQACSSRRSFEELKKAPWLELLKGRLNYAQLQALDREAPERLTVPSGGRISLVYEPGRPPILAVRIQEVFGLRETPRIAGGRVRVLLHLLAPNMRTQQITDDLESFWANGYPQVRKDLRGRYPKHAWPEDPHTEPAARGPKTRK